MGEEKGWKDGGSIMAKKNKKVLSRIKRHRRIRKKVFGTSDRPRVSVYKSLRHIYAQVIDDTAGKTLISVSTLGKNMKEKISGKTKKEKAKEIGILLGKMVKEKDINKLRFDRGGFKYHGRVKSFAEGLKESGIEV